MVAGIDFFGRRSALRGWLTAAVAVTVVASVAATGWTGAAASSATYSSHLLRYPYVTEVVANSATLAWGTDRSQSTSTAVWGPVTNGVCTPANQVAGTSASITVGTTAEYQWRAELSFPTSGTYCYRVLLGTTDLLGADSSPQVATAAAPGTSYSFAVVGDWGAATTGEANVMSQIGKSPASFVVTAGDNVYNSGTDTEYGDLTQGTVFPPQYLPALHGRPIFATQGNHGFTTNLPYLQNFPARTAAAASGGRNVQESYCCISTMTGTNKYASSWYAFDWGSARFYVLEGAWADGQGGYQGDFLAHWNGAVAGCAACGAEMVWLKADLAAHASTRIKFAFSHYPFYSDASGQSSDTYLQGPNGLEGVLANNNVGIIFNGHAHQYERNYPQIAGKPLVSYVTGNGGDSLGSISTCSAFDAYAIGSGSSCRAPKPASDAQVFGFLLVTVQGSKVTVTPTDSNGATYDQQTYDYSSLQITVDTSPPSVPGGVSGAATSTTAATLSWSPSTDDSGVVGYDVFRNGAVVASVAGSITTYSDTGLSPATTYQYSVSARDSAGNSSGPSPSVSVTTLTPPVPDTVIDSGPTVLTNATSATIAFHSTLAGATFTCTLDTATATACTSPASLTGLAGGSHQFTVTSTASAVTDPTPAKTAWTVDTAPPAVPSGVTGAAASTTSATLSWSPSTDNTGVVGYDVFRNGAVVASVAGSITTYSDTGLSPATTYQYAVSARDAAGNSSGPSPTVSVATPASADSFSVAVSPGAIAVSAGSLGSTTVTTAVVSASAIPLTLTASGMPAGALLSFSPPSITSGGASVVTIGTSATTPVGTVTITITATGSGVSHSATISLTVNPPSTGGPAFVQSASASETAASTALTATFPSVSTAGHLLVLSVSEYTGATNTISSVTDSAGGTWTRIASRFVSGHNSDGEQWYSANAKAVTSVTAHTASASTMALTVQEFSGVATTNPLDVSTGASATGTAASSGSVTSTVANDLVVGYIAGHASTQTIAVTSLGYLVQPQVISTGTIATVVSGYQVQGAAGPVVMAGSFPGAMYWSAGVAAFRSGV